MLTTRSKQITEKAIKIHVGMIMKQAVDCQFFVLDLLMAVKTGLTGQTSLYIQVFYLVHERPSMVKMLICMTVRIEDFEACIHRCCLCRLCVCGLTETYCYKIAENDDLVACMPPVRHSMVWI